MKKETNFEQHKNSLPARLKAQILFGQKSLANYLNTKCRNISSKGLLALLITFTVLISTFLLRLILNAIQ